MRFLLLTMRMILTMSLVSGSLAAPLAFGQEGGKGKKSSKSKSSSKEKSANNSTNVNESMRERHIVKEARLKGDSTNLDFEKTSITGQRKTPMGTMIGQRNSEKDYDFIRIRMDWHPEMVQAAKSLDTGTEN